MRSSSLIPLLLFLCSFALHAKPFPDTECQECHAQKGYSVPQDDHGAAGKRLLHVDPDALGESVHGHLACTDCHADVEKLPHRKDGLQTVDCVSCHQTIKGDWVPSKRAAWLAPEPPRVVTHTREYTLSAHADTSIANNATCATCHTAHYVFPSDDSRASTYRLNSPEMCGACHEKQLKEYRQSMHGAALKTPWKGDSATCADCHSSHQVSDMEKTPAHRVVTENCGECHAAELDGYMTSPHGQLAWHGNQDAPKCVDCHEGHTITHVSETRSPVNPANRVKTCQKCHEKANEQFAKYDPHATTRNFEKYPAMWLIGKGMGALIIIVILFFYLHSVLWFWREKKERPVIYRRDGSFSYPVRVKHKKPNSGVHFRRFSWYWRVNHWMLALSLMSLVFSGMVVMYPNTSWAMMVVPLFGGPELLNDLHHWAGVIFLLTIFGHAAVVLMRLLKDKEFDWFGPDSLLPRWRDWEDMKGQFRWYFGKGKQPRFDRWTYWEKFDYWAVYWGALVIGVSGILLWFAESIGQVLPGWIFNVATLAHGLEAFLAVMTLFVVHFFNNHFRPAKFPLDTVMFTGSWDLEELKEERPEEYERLKASGELEKHLVAPPSKTWNRVSHLFGFTLLGIGLILLMLVVNGFLTRGLF
ncbi:cytochrome b/b6 domain-containing protein [Candidatus Endoriftia persephone]|jgi:cytochrome b subunit of formate dehydrogenase/nitrate/TMAO reductase-like tetraheme cytochrome c subunit|uniref:Cytochrome c family protein n=3 Tax=Gammaproteobacteria TaxID=1236 RepID=G2FHK7_9GAMM|nr:cytochrome b/b6 domain-containing protein [Candidatus Endoriftia persephone]EGV50820.1 cytochrome c family protein [endosymbiont of Riftia pachyptila (vent Ph05)]EGW53767.1 cytochrome c family protein [endosymbiont of Tevnia jerichonana (vent Tica)]USF86465.1 cytochrome b/b6 domain-containing protein [Candidatus Endoriftia persephone]